MKNKHKVTQSKTPTTFGMQPTRAMLGMKPKKGK